MTKSPVKRVKVLYAEYPSQFWVVLGASFIDHIGGALLFPFFALYVTRHFNVGMTEVGILFAIFSVAQFFGSMFGGALTDQIGRKHVIIIGLVLSALSSLTMGFVHRIEFFYLLAVLAGIFADMAGPAHQAMITDLLPEEKHADGFGLMRVTINLATAIGPAIGGFLAAYSFLLLFAADALSSIITAFIFYKLVEETRPQTETSRAAHPDFKTTFRGYLIVLKDRAFITFMLLSIVITVVYTQMYGSLPVFLRDIHQISASGFGMIMSLNATIVVLFQLAITRRIRNEPPMLMMSLGALFYAVGFSLYGFVNNYTLFMLAMAIITIGEMIVSPVAQALVAKFSPEDMRGRYMAVFGISWLIPGAVGPLLAGAVMDAGKPLWVWYGSGLLGLVAAFGFSVFHKYFNARQTPPVPPIAAEEDFI